MARTGHSVTILTATGDIVPNAPIEIRFYSTGLLANIYERDGTPITQLGATADANGIFRFWAEAGEYFARHSGVDVPVTVASDTISTEELISLASAKISASTVLEMKSKDLSVNDIIYTSGHVTSGDGGASTYIIKTASQAAADGDEVDELGSHTLSNGLVAVIRNLGDINFMQFGAVRSNTLDSSLSIKAAVDYAIKNKLKIVASGVFRVDSTVDYRGCEIEASGSDIRINHAGIGMIIGGFSNDPANKRQVFGQVIRTSGVDSRDTPSIRCIGARGQRVDVEYTTYFQCYADSDSSSPLSSNIAYSEFNLKHATTIELTTNNNTDGTLTQWINENVFNLKATEVLLINGTYSHNNNIFNGGAFEGGNALIDMEVGRSNRVVNVRGEQNIPGAKLTVNFNFGVQDCYVEMSWVSSGHLYYNDATIQVNNLGEMCAVLHDYDIVAPLIPFLGLHYSTLKKVGIDYNVQFVKNIDIGVADLSGAVGAEIYRSQLIPATTGNGVFEVDAFESIGGGGIRVQVYGYDVNRDLIISAPNQVNFAGAGNKEFGEDDTGVNNNNRSRFYVIDGSCRYIEIVIRIGGAGLSCKSMYVGGRYADLQQRKVAIAHTHTINNFV